MLVGNNILLLIALAFFVGAIIFGFTSKDSWKNTGIVYTLLVIGIILFNIVLIL